MERIRVKVQSGIYQGQLGHVLVYANAADIFVVLDTGEMFSTIAFNLLAVGNAWQWPQPPVGGYGGTIEKGEAS